MLFEEWEISCGIFPYWNLLDQNFYLGIPKSIMNQIDSDIYFQNLQCVLSDLGTPQFLGGVEVGGEGLTCCLPDPNFIFGN